MEAIRPFEDEELVDYLWRALQTARAIDAPVRAEYGGTAFLIEPGMSARDAAKSWFDARHPGLGSPD